MESWLFFLAGLMLARLLAFVHFTTARQSGDEDAHVLLTMTQEESIDVFKVLQQDRQHEKPVEHIDGIHVFHENDEVFLVLESSLQERFRLEMDGLFRRKGRRTSWLMTPSASPLLRCRKVELGKGKPIKLRAPTTMLANTTVAEFPRIVTKLDGALPIRSSRRARK
eukprot:TRINITY_DN26640_c0_g1_i1.p1 TRINITY_DN26640_c0_g1~~TRINITY_DN26640_c0_g1_i1.p1  ORF type:complete len:167 (+),score=27.30 TRINITY_DN26640_c0_g1_i1:82-582(+)